MTSRNTKMELNIKAGEQKKSWGNYYSRKNFYFFLQKLESSLTNATSIKLHFMFRKQHFHLAMFSSLNAARQFSKQTINLLIYEAVKKV